MDMSETHKEHHKIKASIDALVCSERKLVRVGIEELLLFPAEVRPERDEVPLIKCVAVRVVDNLVVG